MEIKPMLCESGTEDVLDSDGHAAELKADGTRVILEKMERELYVIYNRKGVYYTERLPEIIEAAKAIPAASFTLDGEIVWFDPDGRTVFKGSQVRCSTQDPIKQRAARLKYPIVMLTFDALEVDGKNIENWRYEDRKDTLRQILDESSQDKILRLPHIIDDKRGYFEEVVAKGEEGVIAKRLGSRYERRRSRSWLKVRRWIPERVRVVGYTEGTGKRAAFFGSLILAKPDDEGFLVYCGKVGSGFTDAEVKQVYRMLSAREVDQNLVTTPEKHQPVNVNMEVAVKYYEATKAGVFRFPSLLKDDRGRNQIFLNSQTIQGTPRPMDLKSLLQALK